MCNTDFFKLSRLFKRIGITSESSDAEQPQQKGHSIKTHK